MSTLGEKDLIETQSQAEPAQAGVLAEIFEGPVFKAVMKLSVPMFVSLLLSFLYNATNTLFLSYVNRDSTAIISGITLATPIYNFVAALSNGLRVGISTRVAISIGEKNQEKSGSIFNSGLLLAVPVAVVIMVGGYFFCEPVIRNMAGDALEPEAISAGIQYLYYMLPGFGLFILGQVFMGVLWGEGRTVPLGIAMLISNLVNIILDPLFIFVFHMGPGGAGLATSVSMAFTSVYIIVIFARRKSGVPVRLKLSSANRGTVLEICRTGLSQVLSMISVTLSFIILNRVIGSIGQLEMNSWGLCNRLDQFVFIPLYAISSANLVMTGQNFGKKNWERIREIYRCNTRYALVSVLIPALVYMAGAPVFFRLFSDVDQVIVGSVLQVRIVTLTFLGIAVETISMNTFMGLDQPLKAFALITFRMFVLSIPLVYISIYVLSLGMTGVFISLCTAHIISGCIAFLWIKRSFHNIILNEGRSKPYGLE